MPPPTSLRKITDSLARSSTLFPGQTKETVVSMPGSSFTFTTTPQQSTPRPVPVDGDLYAKSPLPTVPYLPIGFTSEPSMSNEPSPPNPTGLRSLACIPPFKSVSSGIYVSNYPKDEADWSEPCLPVPQPSGLGPCRNFRDPYAAAREEHNRHFAMLRQRRLAQLFSATETLKDRLVLSNEGPASNRDPLVRSQDFQEPDVNSKAVDYDQAFAGEVKSPDIPSPQEYRNAAEELVGQDDLFSDVAEPGEGADNDDKEEWDAEFVQAPEDFSTVSEGRLKWENRYEHIGPEAQVNGYTRENSYGAAEETVPGSTNAAIAIDPAVAPPVKRIPLTGTPDRAYPLTLAPSPTESQLAAMEFEFHNAISEGEQIARLGDKAFRKTLREVLPSLTRKQQWYAWRRVNEETGNIGPGEGREILEGEGKNKSWEGVYEGPGNGEECDSGHRHCDRPGWGVHPGETGKIERELGEHVKDTMPKRVGGKNDKENGECQPVSKEDSAEVCENTFDAKRGRNGEPGLWGSPRDCAGGDNNCRCSPDTCSCKNSPRTKTHYQLPALNVEVVNRPADSTRILASRVREELDLAHDVPAHATSRLPGLGIFDLSSDEQSTHEPIRCSVEPEMPRRQLLRESTPAFDDRSPSPSPASHRDNPEDIEMTNSPSDITSALHKSRLLLCQSTSSLAPLSSPFDSVAVAVNSAWSSRQSWSRSKPSAKASAPVSHLWTPKLTKRSGRRKSAVQRAKVEKTGTGKSGAVSRKMMMMMMDREKAGGKVKEAVAKIETNVKGEQKTTQRRSARIRAKQEKEGIPLK